MPLELYNTLSKRKETFAPIEPGVVRMYNCGPTVYSYAHIGNFASFLLADLLRRYLEYSGYRVLQIMNITDVGHLTVDNVADAQGEDKLERKAREEKKDPWQIARFYEEAFHADRRLLNLAEAHQFPRATDHIPEMIALIEELIRLGMAYEAGGQVYFEIQKFPAYGVLSGNSVEELMAGESGRVEADTSKRHPLDFTLWKKDPKHIMRWESPWGVGFPGWHIECSAMSRKYLGDVFDIHTGGEDNIFPHHECEIAQSSGGTGRICARYWLHRRYILVDGKKMSKSLGNFFTVRDLLEKGYSPLEIRYCLLQGHYRANSNFTFPGLEAARQTLRYFREFRGNMLELPERAPAAGEIESLEKLAQQSDAEFRAGLDDDLNVSEVFAVLHAFVAEAYKTALTRPGGKIALRQLDAWDRVLGFLQPEAAAERKGGPAPEEVERWIGERNAARARKDFREADRIRDLLKAQGIVLKDTAQGTRWTHEDR